MTNRPSMLKPMEVNSSSTGLYNPGTLYNQGDLQERVFTVSGICSETEPRR